MQNILLLSPGSKVSLARIVAQACQRRGIELHGIDLSKNVPTSHFIDSFQTIDKEGWPDSVLQYCLDHNIGLVIPSRHSDLVDLTNEKAHFDSHGIQIGISSPETISLCINKLNTYDFLIENGFPSPETFLLTAESSERAASSLPLFVKPIEGSGSEGVTFVNRVSEIAPLAKAGHFIAQAPAAGLEYTINVYISKEGECLCAIPHRRIVVENGESVQAITERVPKLIELAQAVSNSLPGAWGLLNIQAFYDSHTNSAQIIEINPRVGGGFPLAHQAGGSYIEWLVQESLEGKKLAPFEQWTSGLRMMRYREAIFDFPDA